MATGHIGARLLPFLRGTLQDAERAEIEAHLLACAACREERALLEPALMLVPALPEREVRAGFAATVALAARDARHPLLGWLRFSFGGLALASLAVAGVLLVPRAAPRPAGEELKVAQRLELFEDLAVVQNEAALEDFEVVESLHTLEARP